MSDENQSTDPMDQVISPEDLGGEEQREPLKLEIKVETKSACERHVTVTVSEEDIQRYFSKQFDDLMPHAAVPGFRPGRAPRRLVESRFREQVADQVKGALLLDSMSQVNEEQNFSAISEPDFNFEAIKVPEQGPMTYEFDIEVRPEFEMPNWKGLELERLTKDISDDDVEKALARLLRDQSALIPHDGPAEADDYVVVTLTSTHDGKTLASSDELTVPVLPELAFPEASIEGFDKLMIGAKSGDTRTTQVTLSDQIDDAELQGKEVELSFQVLDVKRQVVPEIDESVLESFGMETADKLKEAIRSSLERQLEYRAGQHIRQQISALLTDSADWDLPPDLLKRQFRRELERAVLEMRSSGFDEATIRAYENDLRQNTMERTRTALQEHFILERIAEDESIDADSADYDREVMMIAIQQQDSPRRVRARLERRGQMDALRNQIIERKVLDRIKSEATFKDIPYDLPGRSSEGVEFSLIGADEESDIPEARYSEQAEMKTPGQA